jgi:HlyD family type I secretion membrane fusion protein
MTASLFVLRPRPEGAAVAVRSFESATAEAIANSPIRSERMTIWVLVAMLVTFIVFISVFQLDRIVKTSGRIVPIAGTITVQPLSEAIIKTIRVSVGDVVRKGQMLASLDPTFAVADLGQVFAAKGDSPYEAIQANIFRQRKIDFDASLNSFDEKIHADEATIVGLQHAIDSFKAHTQIAAQIETMEKTLETKGYASTLSRLTATGTRIDLNQQMLANQDNLKTTEHTLESLKADRESFLQKWHSDNLTELVTNKNLLDTARRDLAKAQKVAELTELVAPEDAVVVSVPKLTGGAVASEAEPLFSLVPLGAGLEADVQVDAQDIGFVRVGQKVSIKLDAYKFLEHGTADGVVKSVTQESFTDDPTQDTVTSPMPSSSSSSNRAPYYDVHVAITSTKLHDVPSDFHLIPGMTLAADLIVGQRTILWYLFGSAMRSGSEAMREP